MFRSVLFLAFLAAIAISAFARADTITADFDDLKRVPAAKNVLDEAAKELRKAAQGNEGGVSIKSATGKNVVIDLDTKKPIAGIITVVFDVHHRHRVSQDGWIIVDTPLGRIKTKRPGVIAYDRHQDVLVEYDIKEGKGKARLAKGPIDLPLIPRINWDLWIHVNGKK